MKVQGLRRIPPLLLGLILGFSVAVPVAANSTNQHTVGGTTHGHTIPSQNDMHALTVRLGDNTNLKHASVDHEDLFTTVCEDTGTEAHVHCDAFDIIITKYGSHHTGPGITNHYMFG